MIRRGFFYIFMVLAIIPGIKGQITDSVSFSLYPRLSFYSGEPYCEVLLHVPHNLIWNNLAVTLRQNNDSLTSWNGIPGKKIVRISFPSGRTPGKFSLVADIRVPGRRLKYSSSCILILLEHKSNEVKSDRYTGGLIVNQKPFFPFGFYCYSPFYKTFPEEEAVKGFNLISPYQKVLPETLRERKSYMDRCAELGMKVHYNLLSVAGGGGAASKIEGFSPAEKKELLINEINTFKDHPALLAWYISDEPTVKSMPPDSLQNIYSLIRELDPWHPVSIVFMAPFITAKKYSEAMDIVLADPYPVPNSSANMAGEVAASLSSEFQGKKPVWIVPQAFGGGEWWDREPTLQEMRAMTYQAIIKGARGIQYFVRQGPNYFPKSTSAWGECGRMATEIAELTPWLLSEEPAIAVRSGNPNIILTSAVHDNRLMIMAANRLNVPQRTDFTVSRSLTGKAEVIFENRSISMAGGYFSDQLSAFGTQVYMINFESHADSLKLWKDNLVNDPGFEDISSPGVPASCYARNGGDRGATYFLDSREHAEGDHSIRLVTPGNDSGVKLRFFPFRVMNGQSYYISVRAKGDPDQVSSGPRYFELSLGDYGKTRFELTDAWKEFVTIVTIPWDNDQPPRMNIQMQMTSPGTGWFDMLQASPALDIRQSINPEFTNNEF